MGIELSTEQACEAVRKHPQLLSYSVETYKAGWSMLLSTGGLHQTPEEAHKCILRGPAVGAFEKALRCMPEKELWMLGDCGKAPWEARSFCGGGSSYVFHSSILKFKSECHSADGRADDVANSWCAMDAGATLVNHPGFSPRPGQPDGWVTAHSVKPEDVGYYYGKLPAPGGDGILQFDRVNCAQGDTTFSWRDVTVFLATSSATYEPRATAMLDTWISDVHALGAQVVIYCTQPGHSHACGSITTTLCCASSC